ncbi:MAG TPA: hypothetical protein PLQ36_03425 [Candidatus Gracilibacteria bacterium]|nr:hypothetical protein [Candidatus Gracilibacteria bacterium]
MKNTKKPAQNRPAHYLETLDYKLRISHSKFYKGEYEEYKKAQAKAKIIS